MPGLQPLPCCNGMQTAAEPWRCAYRPLWSCQRGGHLNFKGSNWTAGCVHAVWECMYCICILKLIHSLTGDLRTSDFLSVSYITYNSFTIFRLRNIRRIFFHIFSTTCDCLSCATFSSPWVHLLPRCCFLQSAAWCSCLQPAWLPKGASTWKPWSTSSLCSSLRWEYTYGSCERLRQRWLVVVFEWNLGDWICS